MIDRWRPISGTMIAYGFSIAFAGAFALQFFVDPRGELTLLLGAVTLLAIGVDTLFVLLERRLTPAGVRAS